MHRVRRRIARLASVDDEDRSARARQKDGTAQTGGAAADREHVIEGSVCHSAPTIDGRAPFWQAMLPKWQYFVMDHAVDETLASVAPRLRALRQQREWTLATLA